MLIRIISSIAGLPVLASLVIFGGIWLQVGLTAVIIIALVEFYRAFGSVKAVHCLGLAAAILHMVLLSMFPMAIPVLPTALILLSMILLVVRNKTHDINNCTITLFGYFYIAVTLSVIYLIRETFGGTYEVWLVFIAAWGCDTGAYFSGWLFGRRKLAPALSPKKTVEGAIGGTMIATLLGAAYGFVLYSFGLLDTGHILLYAVVAFVCSIAGQFGDLAASAIKRHREIKDFGNIMPGHGGALDRFDSIIFTAPFALLMLYVMGVIGT